MPGMSHTITITAIERAPFASTKVDREAGHIDGVLICGLQSRNGRDYPTSVLSRDYARYEGAAVNCDHADESTVGRRLGWFSDVKPGADGRPRGRLNLLKSHPMSAAVFEAAERNPSLFGMSHVAVCGTKRINGRETVESINKVLSIDLVADPATTKSLYESYHPTGQPMKLTTYCEQVAAKWPAGKPNNYPGHKTDAWFSARCAAGWRSGSGLVQSRQHHGQTRAEAAEWQSVGRQR